MYEKFAPKKRIYTTTYKHFEMLEFEDNHDKDDCKINRERINLGYSGKLHESCRSHRYIDTVEGYFVKKVTKECIVIN